MSVVWNTESGVVVTCQESAVTVVTVVKFALTVTRDTVMCDTKHR